MQAGFTVYSQAVKHHSLMLAGQQKEIEELKQANVQKDATIGELAESSSRKDAKIEELEEAKVKMAATIEGLEKRINRMQQTIGTEHWSNCQPIVQ